MVAGGVDRGRDLAWRHPQWPARRLERFVVSFPKSGRTWLRVMLGAVEAHIRGVGVDEGVREWIELDAPSLGGTPVLITHALTDDPRERPAAIESFLGYIGDRRRLFLVRDPRDVVVSYYFQHAKRQRTARWQGAADISRFVRDPDYGIDRVLAFYRACSDSLQGHEGPSLLLTYEDLHRDASGALKSVVEFFEAEVSQQALEAAVRHGRFESMRRMEVEESFVESRERLATRDPGDPESLKTRRGLVGGFGEYLAASDLEYVEDRIADLMPAGLGYREPGVPAPGRDVGEA